MRTLSVHDDEVNICTYVKSEEAAAHGMYEFYFYKGIIKHTHRRRRRWTVASGTLASSPRRTLTGRCYFTPQ